MRVLLLTACCFLLFTPVDVIAGELDSQIVELQNDIDNAGGESKKLFGKDAPITPLPIPISNPTVGTGLAFALMYMHPQDTKTQNTPTTTTSIAGMYTNTDSWAAGGVHDGYYRTDLIRFRVPVAYGEFNLKFYGIGNDSPLKNNPVKYQAVTTLVIPRLLFHLPWDNWFVGGEYRLLNINSQFDVSNLLLDAPGIDERAKTAGLGLISVYDSRDSNFWPSKGNWLELSAICHGSYAGGDFEYGKLITKWAQYFPLGDTINWVYRLDGQFIDGAAPFWDLSRVRLRGYAGGQLLDDVAVTAQTEVRWNVYDRWTVLAFVGTGLIADSINKLGSAPKNWAAGGGLKYMLVEKQKLTIGIDLAYAEGESVSVYFQIGDWLAN